MSRLGIPSEQALRLLHKAQSMKNIGDLNSFMRDLMLEKPGTFEVAHKLVEEFTNLNDAYFHVQKARQQIDLLAPTRQFALERATAMATGHKLKELNLGIEHYVALRRRTLYKEAIDSSIDAEEHIQRAIASAQHVARDAEGRLDELKRALWEAGGESIDRLRSELAAVEARRDRCAVRRSEVVDALKQMSINLPTHASGFAELVAALAERSRALEGEITTTDVERVDLMSRRSELTKQVEAIDAELQSLSARKSNIPMYLQQVRSLIVTGIGCNEDDLPFAGELLKVRDDEAPWRGAIERLVGKFSTSMLVPDRLYPQVRRFVNETHLRQNLSYHLASSSNQARAREVQNMRAVFRKLEIAPGPFHAWIDAELRSRFNHECVESADELSRFEFALTRQGQVRGGRSLHEKRDRFHVDDESQWSLGWDNSERRRLFEGRRASLRSQLSEVIHEEQARANALTSRLRAVRNAEVVKNVSWSDIDAGACDQRKGELEAEINRIRSGSKDLAALDKQVADQREVLTRRNADVAQHLESLRSAHSKRNHYRKTLEDLEGDASYVEPTPTQREGLDARFASIGRPITIDSVGDINSRVQRALSVEIEKASESAQLLRTKIETAFTEFKTRWPAEAADMDASVESGEAYFAMLDVLERDRLPAFESRFRDMLQNQSDRYLATLQRKLSDEARAIEGKIDSVNEALRNAPFGKDTFLEIRSRPIHQQDVTKFRAQLKDVLAQSFTTDAGTSEARFHLMKVLVERLGSTKPEDERWRATVLDVRQHVEFVARETDDKGHEVETYAGGGGKSGGQRQKLTTTCLAAALRFQLVAEGETYPKFAPVAMDEAFDKADHEFTTMALGIFKTFGFQIIVATPMKAVTTFEPFIGGATMVSIRDKRYSSTLPLTVQQLMDAAREGPGVAA